MDLAPLRMPGSGKRKYLDGKTSWASQKPSPLKLASLSLHRPTRECGFLATLLQRLRVAAHTLAPAFQCIKRHLGFQPGRNGQITLEICNNGPLSIELIPTEDMPCQVTFYQLTSELEEALAYGARPTDVFQAQVSPISRQP